MKEINIGKTIINKRKEKGITQDELAEYIGVSKASVSKWETGQSYPDITFLPQLAAYFNISIDELIGYSPQMAREDIRKLYIKLSSDFAAKSFNDVWEECREVIKKYYSCFPLLFQMAVLLINHFMLAKDADLQKNILEEAVELCLRIKAESDDVWLSKDAASLEASCYLLLQKPANVLDLLGDTIRPISCDDSIIAQAYQMMGKTSKANEVFQIGMYQHLIVSIGTAPSLLMFNVNNTEKFKEILNRILAVADIFNLNRLNPNIMLQIYLSAAQCYSMQGNTEGAVDMLRKYEHICTTIFFPYSLHGDDFFNAIDSWLAEFNLTQSTPRDEKVIKSSMLQAVTENPAFAALAEHPVYKSIVENLKLNYGGN